MAQQLQRNPERAPLLRGAELKESCLRNSKLGKGSCSRITPEIWQGNRISPAPDNISALKINGVVSLHGKPHEVSGVAYHVAHVEDDPQGDLLTILPTSTEFMHRIVSSGGTVLVHCSGGFSRSPSVVIAYLIRYRGLTLEDAFEVVRHANKHARPNSGFLVQLRHWSTNNSLEERAERPGEGGESERGRRGINARKTHIAEAIKAG